MKKSSPKYLLAGLLIGVHIWQASLVRPVADDYTLLKIYSQEGYSSFISYIWSNFGGNITPAVIRAAYLSFSVDASNWYGFMAFAITTSILVIASYLVLITWLTNRSLRQITISDLLISLLASLAFEGLFTPGLSSAYLFGAAAGVHLWPICIFVLALKFIESRSDKQSKLTFPGFLMISMFLGFVVGNSALAESSAIFVVLLVITIGLQIKKPRNFGSNIHLALRSHLLGVGVGLLTIFIAPGFRNRNNRLGKSDDGLLSLLESFRSSLVSFLGEVLTHPIWLLAILLVASKKFLFKIDSSRAKILSAFFTITCVMLVLGSTFGYAAWHQSSGLIFLLTPVVFSSPLSKIRTPNVLKKFIFRLKYFPLAALALILIGLMTRGVVAQEIRSATWDSNFSQNYCSIMRSANSPLLGAEIRYWPIGLGVEDVNQWDWMARDYVSWLDQISPHLKTPCK
jgi:hypothetical protein